MKLNDQQKQTIQALVFDCFDVKNVFENSPENFEDEDYDEATDAVYDYIQDMHNYVLEGKI